MARERDDDYEDDTTDRPARRRDGGAIDKPGGLDGFFSNIAVAIVFAVIGVFCCPCLSVILGGIGLATSKTPDGKKGAMICLIGGVIGLVLNGILFATGAVNPNQFRQ